MSRWFVCSMNLKKKTCLEICLSYRLQKKCVGKCEAARRSLLNRFSLVKSSEVKEAVEIVSKNLVEKRTYKLADALNIVSKYMEGTVASRPELVEMCKELDIESKSLSIQEMKGEVRKEADRLFNKDKKVSADKLSETLKKFLSLEYDYIIRNKEGEDLNYKGQKIKKKTRKKRRKK